MSACHQCLDTMKVCLRRCDGLQVTKDMWHLFEREFRNLWTAAVKQGKGGELALDVLFGSKAPAGAQTLQVI